MEIIIENLAQYGPLGLWTASLLWMNHQQRKDKKEEEKAAKDALTYHQENIVNALAEQAKMLEKAVLMIDGGLRDMRQKYAEERMQGLKGN